jgi:hypothetical protein
MPDKDYMAVLLEETRDQNKAVLEAVADIKRSVRNQPTRFEFEELRQDVAVMRLLSMTSATTTSGVLYRDS